MYKSMKYIYREIYRYVSVVISYRPYCSSKDYDQVKADIQLNFAWQYM